MIKISPVQIMKKSTLILFLALSFMFCGKGYAQAPLLFNYQAVLRDGGGQLLINQQVQIRISILQNSSFGPEVFSETHTPTTNDNGLIAILVGSGTPINGNISDINWGNGTYYLKSEVDPTGGSNYTLTSTQQLLSVPYALFSNGGDYTNLINKPDIPDIVNSYFEAHHLVDTIYVMNMGYDTVYTYVHDTVFTHIYDTVHTYHQDTLNTYHFDTTFTHSFDTIHAYHQDTVNTYHFDTTFTHSFDTIHAYHQDTVSTYHSDTTFTHTFDTVYTYHQDTINTYHFDTTFSHTFDTVHTYHQDSLNTYHFDTTFTHTFDTIHTYHQDTVNTYHFDTVYNRTYDTTYTHSYDTVHEFRMDTAYVDSVMANYHETQGLPEVVSISNSAANHQIKDVEDPTAPMDAVNKRYFDSVLTYVCNRYDSILSVFQHRIDSLDTVIASLTPCVATHSIDNQEACDHYTWMDGITYTASTTFPTFTTTNIAGCDSVITLHLTINHGTHTSDSATASISYIWHDTTYTASGTYTYNYLDVNGCSSTDTLHLSINTNVTLSTPFYVEDVSGSTNTLHIVKNSTGAPTVTLDYSYDGSTWTTWGTTSTTALSLNIPANSRVYLRANATQYGNYDNYDLNHYNNCISADRDFAICGNIHSLLQKTVFDTITQLPNTNVFDGLFSGATHLKSAENLLLPATTLTEECYIEMFFNCSSLTNAPALLATTLTVACYCRMFDGCISLTNPPDLPAISLADMCYFEMFHNCSSMTTPPNLPATSLASYCYFEMFEGCTSLTNPPALSASTLAGFCYGGMFLDCTSLTNPPTLPATSLAERCYASMFHNCTSMTNPPALPATTLALGCYSGMFQNCTSLTIVPELPATTLADGCYSAMFYNCTSLTNPPALPATTLAEQCYYRMFYGCTNLTIAPELPATTLTTRCYESMFYGCSNLQQIKVSFTYWNTNNTSNWTYGLPATGTFVCPTGLPHTMNSAGNNSNAHYIPYNWTIEDDSAPVSLSTPFCVENMSVLNNTLHIIKSSSSAPTVTLDYSYDSSTWTTWGTTSTTALSLNIPANSRVYLRANATRYGNSGSINRIYADRDFAVCGNIHSLLQKTNFDTITQLPNPNVFRNLFSGATHLKSAENLILPATSLTDSCYFYMFSGCGTMTKGPSLPATTLTDHCYSCMFWSCYALTEAPELPATTLAQSCYNQMFFGCPSLTEAPELPATTLAEQCYHYMFNSCTSLINAPALPATTLAKECYSGMFLNCTSLINAPALPATTLAERCYVDMFHLCSSLINAPNLPATTLANECYRAMFRECTALTVVPAILPATTLAVGCYRAMFDGCTALTVAPELPATTLTTRCYDCMFYDCSNLQYIKVAFTNWWVGELSTSAWTHGLPATGTFVCPTDLPHTMNSAGNNSSDSHIPYNWTITTY